MFCPFCGTDNKDQTKFCGGCGQLIPENAAPKTEAPKVEPVVKTPTVKPSVVRYKKQFKPHRPNENPVFIGLTIFQFLLYAGISTLSILLLTMKDTIVIFTESGKGKEVTTVLNEILNLMLKGCRLFNPTVTTTVFANMVNIFVYSIPVFAAICFFGGLILKKSKAFNITFTTISITTQLLVAVAIPLTIAICPEFNNGIAHFANFLADDIGRIVISKIIIFTCVTAVMTIISTVVTALADKWRCNK